MMTVEREIGSIESANINKETLDAMSNASKAMRNIHGDLTVDKVDQVMEDLRDQHAVGEEIADALTAGAGASGVDGVAARGAGRADAEDGERAGARSDTEDAECAE
jgi:charged multivesicular body protein 4